MLSIEEFRRRAEAIRLLVLDVDGVLTDGGIVFDDLGREIKRFCVRDGFGLATWRRAGREVAIISGRESVAVRLRARELGIQRVFQRVRDKGVAFRQLLDDVKMVPWQVCSMGDDLPDFPLLRSSGLGIAVADAAEELRLEADWVTTAPGGHGAVREIVERILKAQSLWHREVDHHRRRVEGLGEV